MITVPLLIIVNSGLMTLGLPVTATGHIFIGVSSLRCARYGWYRAPETESAAMCISTTTYTLIYVKKFHAAAVIVCR